MQDKDKRVQKSGFIKRPSSVHSFRVNRVLFYSLFHERLKMTCLSLLLSVKKLPATLVAIPPVVDRLSSWRLYGTND